MVCRDYNCAMTTIILVLATLATALVSGVFSMAGGMILMGVFGFMLSVPAAMVLHGVAQSASNGSRVWLYRHDIRWSILVPYSAGAALVLLLFSLVILVPPIGLVFLLIGLFPFVSLKLPASLDLNIERGPVAFICGVMVTLAQMLAGASGPILDVFYVRSTLNRRQVLGTKAITQTLGHLLKLGYYGALLGAGATTGELPAWILPATVAAAIAGNVMASFVVARISDHQFTSIGRRLVQVIGMVFIGKGIWELSGW